MLNKYLVLYQVLFIQLISFSSSEDKCNSGDGWTQFKNEKCILLIRKLVIQSEAKELCLIERQKSGKELDLISIDSPEEHEFVNQLLTEENIEENVWIDLMRSETIPTDFGNSEQSKPQFEAWAQNRPTNDQKRKCVQLKSPLKKDIPGKWEDVVCFRKNYVLCQRYLKWDPMVMQKEIIKSQRHLDSIHTIFNEIKTKTENFFVNDLENRLASVRAMFESMDKKMKEIDNKTELVDKEVQTLEIYTRDLVNNPVPMGFIYAQLPNQREPSLIWPSVQWTDISDQYSGLFFRVFGNETAPLKTVQEENCPRLKEIGTYLKEKGIARGGSEELKANDKWSRDFFTGTDSGSNKYYFHVKMSSGEVRPRNTAIVIWKRTK